MILGNHGTKCTKNQGFENSWKNHGAKTSKTNGFLGLCLKIACFVMFFHDFSMIFLCFPMILEVGREGCIPNNFKEIDRHFRESCRTYFGNSLCVANCSDFSQENIKKIEIPKNPECFSFICKIRQGLFKKFQLSDKKLLGNLDYPDFL